MHVWDLARAHVAALEEFDAALAGVTHRSLFGLDDVYIHYVEMEEDFTESVDQVREHPLFKEISRRLDDHITPYDPETWRSPKDATAREFYTWDKDEA